MQVDVGSFSHGAPGHENEDAILSFGGISDHVLAIADGVGGHQGGAQASQMAVKAIRSYFQNDFAGSLEGAYRSVHQELASAAERDPTIADLATTLTTCIVSNYQARFGHVGDSRLYHIRNRGLQTRTVDQTEARRLIEEGVLTPRAAQRYPRKNILLSALSAAGDYALQQGQFDVAQGDRLLLLTDGVHKLLTKRQILELSLANSELLRFIEALLETIRGASPDDDYSMIVANIE
jgi:PPM family protein phosphatase